MTDQVSNLLFSSLHKSIVVLQGADSTFSWSGDYDGMPIKQAIPLNSGDRCILLFDPDATKRLRLKIYYASIERGSPVWAAKLPSSLDAFLDVTLCPDGLVTHTWSGMSLILDKNTAVELKRTFVK